MIAGHDLEGFGGGSSVISEMNGNHIFQWVTRAALILHKTINVHFQKPSKIVRNTSC